MIEWISEAGRLPKIGQTVLLLIPRQHEEFADLKVVFLTAHHEGVVSRQVKNREEMPKSFCWRAQHGDDISLVTGRNFWAPISSINLPNDFQHRSNNGFEWITKPFAA